MGKAATRGGTNASPEKRFEKGVSTKAFKKHVSSKTFQVNHFKKTVQKAYGSR
jgi:hypothetical protein